MLEQEAMRTLRSSGTLLRSSSYMAPAGGQQHLYRAGQPKKMRLKECGIKDAVPCVSFLAAWPNALAEEVQVGILRQAGRLSKSDEVKLRAGTFETEIGPLNLKGVPRWRRNQGMKFDTTAPIEACARQLKEMRS